MATSEQHAVAFTIRGPISRADLAGLGKRVGDLLWASGARVALCDVQGVEPDAVTVDALCRLQLAARRHRCQVRLCHASAELIDLIAFMGLRDVVPSCELALEPGGKAEERKQRLRVEEERELDDRAP